MDRTVDDDSLLYGTFRLFGNQNVYVEFFWKCLIYRYGYGQAVLRFVRFIQISLCIQENLAVVRLKNDAYRNVTNDTIDKMMEFLTNSGNRQATLWTKKLNYLTEI